MRGSPKKTIHYRSCEHCTEKFEASRKGNRFCSLNCKMKGRRTRMRPPEGVECRQCKTMFHPDYQGGKQQFCSKKCREKNFYEANRETIIAKVNAIQRRHRDARLRDIECANCGIIFHQKRYGDETCGRKCSLGLWRTRNPELYKAHQKRAYQKSRSEAPWRTLVDAAIKRAKEKELFCDITQAWAKERWTGKCELTGIAFNIGHGRESRYLSGSIDRIDPQKGYSQNNCRFILCALNMFKSTATDAEMIMVARALVEKSGMA